MATYFLAFLIFLLYVTVIKIDIILVVNIPFLRHCFICSFLNLPINGTNSSIKIKLLKPYILVIEYNVFVYVCVIK